MENEAVVKKAFTLAVSVIGWILFVTFFMIVVGTLLVNFLGWNAFGAATLFTVLGTILIVVPIIVIAIYIEDHTED